MNMSYLLFAMLLAFCAASCPNECNYNGHCNKDSACVCYRNWAGADCSLRTCYYSHAFMDSPQGDINADGRVNRPDVSIITVVAGSGDGSAYVELDFVEGTNYDDFPANRYVRTSPCTTLTCEALDTSVCGANPLCSINAGACELNSAAMVPPSASDMETSGVVIQSSKAFGLVTGTDANGDEIKKVAFRLAVVTPDGNPPSLEKPSLTNPFPMPDASCLMSADIAALTSTEAKYEIRTIDVTGTCTSPNLDDDTCGLAFQPVANLAMTSHAGPGPYIQESTMCTGNTDADDAACVFTPGTGTLRVKTLTSAAAKDAMFLYDTQFTNAKTWEQYPENHGWANRKSAAPKLKSSYDEAHFYRECSGKGLCDRGTGECECFDGYEGAGCTRTTCPNACSGHGVCVRLGDLPKPSVQWDRHKTQQCVCDAGYTNTDCSGRECSKGDDPITRPKAGAYTFDATTGAPDADGATTYPYIMGTKMTQQPAVQHFGHTAEITDQSFFALEYTDENGNKFMTKTMNMQTVSASDVEAALEALPNNVIEDVAVEARYFDAGLLAVPQICTVPTIDSTHFATQECGGYESISSDNNFGTMSGTCAGYAAGDSIYVEFTGGAFDTENLATGDTIYSFDVIPTEAAADPSKILSILTVAEFSASTLKLRCSSVDEPTFTYLATAGASQCVPLPDKDRATTTTNNGQCVYQTPRAKTCADLYKSDSPCPSSSTVDNCCGQPRMFAVTFLSNSGKIAPLGVRYSVQRSTEVGGTCTGETGNTVCSALTGNTEQRCTGLTYLVGTVTHSCEWEAPSPETDDNGSFRAPVLAWINVGGCDAETCTTIQDASGTSATTFATDVSTPFLWDTVAANAAVAAKYSLEEAEPGAVELDSARAASVLAAKIVLEAETADNSVAASVYQSMVSFELSSSTAGGTERGTEIQKVGNQAGLAPLAKVIGKKHAYDAFASATRSGLNAGYNVLLVGLNEYAAGPLVIGTVGVEGSGENDVCSNRGLCDYDSGLCKCFNGFTEDDCSVQNALAMY